MSTSAIIDTIRNIFGEVELPVCVSVVNNEDGLTLYETKTCKMLELDESTSILGLMAYETLNKSLHARTEQDVEVLVFRSGEYEFFIMPIYKTFFMCAFAEIGKMTDVMPFLEGIANQISFQIKKIQGEKET